VPENYTFWDLHVAIQDSLNWLDSHMHCFSVLKDPKDPKNSEMIDIGIPVEMPGDETIPDWGVKIQDYFSLSATRCVYEYDFGDSWEHLVELESILERDRSQPYPRCIAGEKAGPPEDSGSVDGYHHLCEVLKNPKDKEYKELKSWVNETYPRYDPDKFKVNDVTFHNPSRALKERLGHMFQ